MIAFRAIILATLFKADFIASQLKFMDCEDGVSIVNLVYYDIFVFPHNKCMNFFMMLFW